MADRNENLERMVIKKWKEFVKKQKKKRGCMNDLFKEVSDDTIHYLTIGILLVAVFFGLYLYEKNKK